MLGVPLHSHHHHAHHNAGWAGTGVFVPRTHRHHIGSNKETQHVFRKCVENAVKHPKTCQHLSSEVQSCEAKSKAAGEFRDCVAAALAGPASKKCVALGKSVRDCDSLHYQDEVAPPPAHKPRGVAGAHHPGSAGAGRGRGEAFRTVIVTPEHHRSETAVVTGNHAPHKASVHHHGGTVVHTHHNAGAHHAAAAPKAIEHKAQTVVKTHADEQHHGGGGGHHHHGAGGHHHGGGGHHHNPSTVVHTHKGNGSGTEVHTHHKAGSPTHKGIAAKPAHHHTETVVRTHREPEHAKGHAAGSPKYAGAAQHHAAAAVHGQHRAKEHHAAKHAPGSETVVRTHHEPAKVEGHHAAASTEVHTHHKGAGSPKHKGAPAAKVGHHHASETVVHTHNAAAGGSATKGAGSPKSKGAPAVQEKAHHAAAKGHEHHHAGHKQGHAHHEETETIVKTHHPAVAAKPEHHAAKPAHSEPAREKHEKHEKQEKPASPSARTLLSMLVGGGTPAAAAAMRVWSRMGQKGDLPREVLGQLREAPPASTLLMPRQYTSYRAICTTDGGLEVHPGPELAGGAEELVDAAGGESHVAVLSAAGRVWCSGCNDDGQLGTGDATQPHRPVLIRLPWKAEAVSCGDGVTLALRRGGTAVCSWGGDGAPLGRDGEGALPAEVVGLPADDPVRLIGVCDRDVEEDSILGHAVAITLSDRAYAWHGKGPARHLPALSGLGVRKLAGLQNNRLLVETSRPPELLLWDFLYEERASLGTVGKGGKGGRGGKGDRGGKGHKGGKSDIAFPLRSLAASGVRGVAAADAKGRVWWEVVKDVQSAGLRRASLVTRGCPAGPRSGAVRVGLWKLDSEQDEFSHSNRVLIVLTENGRLLRVGPYGHSVLIDTPRCIPRLGLLPCRGDGEENALLLRDNCGGKERMKLLARIAVRLGIPDDPVREVVVPYVVHNCYITGPPNDPFGCPVHRG
eukprot:TRINITY_DN3038_c0_g1_i2.p1 TRINITY_DN3038_c0_g1~~TRINITY_DN3038_c0_g1_i2.p1  ORF type:complete len:960 (+),score=192.35 TRINITY_DN3038_c0_g1_i2:124-3003(+)